jgi:hypothetical protein
MTNVTRFTIHDLALLAFPAVLAPAGLAVASLRGSR